jgi:hypothetical protein
VMTVPTTSTVGFELPTPELLAQMGADKGARTCRPKRKAFRRRNF